MNALQQRKIRLARAVNDHRLEGLACKLLLCRAQAAEVYRDAWALGVTGEQVSEGTFDIQISTAHERTSAMQ